MNDLSPEEIYQEVGEIVSQFQNLECDICAKAVMQWLKEKGLKGKIIKLRTRKRRDFFIISDRFSPNESVTDNGTHYGVEILGLVFDNLSREGMTREDWLNDFSCASGGFITEELDSLD
ncbi:MAG: papain fold toxin domain-containing protein [Phormidium sp.]